MIDVIGGLEKTEFPNQAFACANISFIETTLSHKLGD